MQLLCASDPFYLPKSCLAFITRCDFVMSDTVTNRCFGNESKVQQVQRICNKFIRLLFGLKRLDSVKMIMKQNGLLNIKQIYRVELAIFTYKLGKRVILLHCRIHFNQNQVAFQPKVIVYTKGESRGGDVGDASPPPAIFKYAFDEYDFPIISNLFDNNKPFALSTHNRKCTNKMHHIWCNTQN